jgi:DNA-binding MarR family transcriptional regulator
VSEMSARAEAVGRIMAAQERLAFFFAFDRSNPILAANLTMPQLKIMLALSLNDGASGQELTRVMHVSLATITGIVDRLASHDLVTRREDPRDRRIRRVELTVAGKELIDGILTAGAQHQRRLLERLDLDALDTVERATRFLLDAAEAERDDESPLSAHENNTTDHRK